MPEPGAGTHFGRPGDRSLPIVNDESGNFFYRENDESAYVQHCCYCLCSKFEVGEKQAYPPL